MRSYEELYDIVAAILIGRENSAIGIKLTEWIRLKLIVAEVITRQDGMNVGAGQHRLAPDEAELVRDVFWDMFRQGFITLGLNDDNAEWPHFRLSHFGQQTLKSGKPFHFTDARSYIELVKQNVPSLDDTTSMYLDEAVRSFYAGCFLAASVMLGVASENRFLSFLESVKASPTHAAIFQKVDEDLPILSKIKKFFFLLESLLKTMSFDVQEDIDIRFRPVQSVIRISRNEAGYPSGKVISRENMYVLLTLFVPYARKLAQLEDYFATA